MATYTYDVVVYGSEEHGCMNAIRAAKRRKLDGSKMKVAIISENQHVGGLTAGMLGFQDFGNPLQRLQGFYGQYLDICGREYGVPRSLLVAPSRAENAYESMLARAGVIIHYGEQIASATLGSDLGGGVKKVTSITMLSGNVFVAPAFADASICNDLVQLAAQGANTFRIGSESSAEFGESKAGYRGADIENWNPIQGSGVNKMVMPDPGLTDGAAWDGIQSYAIRAVYGRKGDCVPFASATIRGLDNVERLVTDPSHYNADDFAFYGQARTKDRYFSIDDMIREGRGFIPNDLQQDNDDFPLVNPATNRPYHWDYSVLNTANPAATYTARAQFDYALKLFLMQSRAWMATDPRFSGAWQDSCVNWGWPKDEFRGNDNVGYRTYVREAVRPVNAYMLQQDDLSVTNVLATRNVYKTDAIGIAGYAFDSHTCAITTVSGQPTKSRLAGKAPNTSPIVNQGGYAVPLRAIYNALRPNLITVGSCSHVAWSSYRIIANLGIIGDASGEVLWYIANGTLPAAIDISALQARIVADGMYIAPLFPIVDPEPEV